MKQTSIFRSHAVRSFFYLALPLAGAVVLGSCSDDDEPVKEDVPELITTVELTFTPVGGGDAVKVTATDPDGEGTDELKADGPIALKTGTTYTMDIKLYNGLLPETDEEYDVTKEVEEESDEHMFFFSWTADLFANPAGNGNIDNRQDPVVYADVDENGLPTGLSTTWSTKEDASSNGAFRVVLKHQPELKSATSGYNTGETDADVSFVINVTE
ncbi:hypothetical protein [Dawidia soli]|uniref:hypothetical protein n=1 Tax=Dawidia soli TaxID=2782352 RepID=UPI0020B350A6|nr:hypothetical protein [Dawidia soli]